MSAKRALVVDDSKSARAFLSRILERHEIAVDAADSAEAAIDYLTRHRPDVIFMDHMMPGMDGFQAVQSIKNNPRTSNIPILMYTSQEGDLYLGQARALGAEGVLPKQIKQADVTKLLFQLRLVADRRGGEEQTTFTRLASGPDLLPANESAIVVEPPAAAESLMAAATPAANSDEPEPLARLLPQMTLEIRAAVTSSLQQELAALRAQLGVTLETQAERLQTDLAAMLPARAPALDLPTVMPERRSWSAILGWSFAVSGFAAAGVMAWLWWNQGTDLAAARSDLAASYSELEALRAQPPVVSPAAVQSVDPALVTPAPDAPDAPAASATDGTVQLVPNGAAPVAPPTIASAGPPPAQGPSAPAASDGVPSASDGAPPASQAK